MHTSQADSQALHLERPCKSLWTPRMEPDQEEDSPEALAHKRTRMARMRRELEAAANSTSRLKMGALASKRAAMALLFSIWLGGG